MVKINTLEKVNMYLPYMLRYRVIRQLLGALLLFLAAKSEDLSEIIDFHAVGAFHKTVIGEVDPGFAI
jgi:hypothetical protein